MNISDHALRAARAIANYCSTRFPSAVPPCAMLDVPWFAEKVQQAIDAAMVGGTCAAHLPGTLGHLPSCPAHQEPGPREE